MLFMFIKEVLLKIYIFIDIKHKSSKSQVYFHLREEQITNKNKTSHRTLTLKKINLKKIINSK